MIAPKEEIMIDFVYYLDRAKENIMAKDLIQARKNLKKAAILRNDSPEINNLLGVIEEIEDNVVEAQKYYRIALERDSNYIPAKKILKEQQSLSIQK